MGQKEKPPDPKNIVEWYDCLIAGNPRMADRQGSSQKPEMTASSAARMTMQKKRRQSWRRTKWPTKKARMTREGETSSW